MRQPRQLTPLCLRRNHLLTKLVSLITIETFHNIFELINLFLLIPTEPCHRLSLTISTSKCLRERMLSLPGPVE